VESGLSRGRRFGNRHDLLTIVSSAVPTGEVRNLWLFEENFWRELH
jgi:hypothetical protein